jgi:hypothetical protein
MLFDATRDQIVAILGAMRRVATADGALPLSETDRVTLEAADRIMFRGPAVDDVAALDGPSGRALADLLPDAAARDHAVAFLAIAAFVDGVVDKRRLDVVLGYARDLGVRTDYVDELTDIARDHLATAAAEMLNRNISSIVNHPWLGADAQAWIVPYRDKPEPALQAR